jgi:hypothetical protein
MDNTSVKLADSIQRRQRERFRKALNDSISLIVIDAYSNFSL